MGKAKIRLGSCKCLFPFFCFFAIACNPVTTSENDSTERRLVEPAPEASVSANQASHPRATGFVNDFAGVLDEATKKELGEKSRNLQRDHAIDFAIIIVDSTNGTSMDDYSLAIAKDWKVGSENGGVLLAVSTQDRKWRIQIDRKIEKLITNEETLRIGEVMLPELKQKEYGNALRKCSDKLITTLTKKLKERAAG
jgi:uncharacterized protein